MVGEYYDIVATKSKEELMQDLYKVLQDMYGDKAVEPEDILIPYSNWPIGMTL